MSVFFGDTSKMFNRRLAETTARDTIFQSMRLFENIIVHCDVPPFLYPLKRRVPVFYGFGLMG
jgi:hypothetical protein